MTAEDERRRQRLTYAEVLPQLRISRATLFRRISAGEIEVVTDGGKRWIEQGAVDDYLTRQRREAAKHAARRKAARKQRQRGPRAVA